jgi:FecR protein
MNEQFERLGRVAKRELDGLVDRSTLANEIENQVLAVAPRRSRRALRLVPVFVFAAAACAFFAIYTGRRSELTFTIAGEGSGQVSSPIVTQSMPKLLAFSEGTTLTVSPQARVRILKTQERNAEVGLDEGTLMARVKHIDADSHWVFRAGPYAVTVTGTAFDLSWDPAVQRMALQMHEGRVLVSGGALSLPREVRAGERLLLGGAMPAVPAAVTQAPEETPPVISPSPPSVPDNLLTVGKLFARADRIRLQGNEREAVHLFQTLSRKHPRDPLAGLAAFAAGRLLLMQLNDPKNALVDLERARRLGLPEPLSEECHARIVQVHALMKNRDACVNEKVVYLRKFRQGSHVAMVANACD